MARRVDPEVEQGGQRAGHQSLAAGLVDGAGARLEDQDVEPGAGGVQGGGEPGRAAAGDDEVPHALTCSGLGSEASAAFSQRIRTVSRAALATVKTTAVIQAECTSGSATPSTTTAT